MPQQPNKLSSVPIDFTALAERLDTVRRQKGWSWREWAQKAQLASQTQVGNSIRRMRDGKGGQNVSLRHIAELAQVAGVSLDMLVFGHSSPVPATAPDAYPSRDAVLAGARLMGFSEPAIAEVRADASFTVDPGRDHWLLVLQAAEAQHRARTQSHKQSAS